MRDNRPVDRRDTCIVLAGGPAVRTGDEVVVARGPRRRRATLVLGYLALEAGRTVPADELAEAVWPEGPPGSWRASLRRLVTDAREWLGRADLASSLVNVGGAYRLDLPGGVEVDVLVAASDQLDPGSTAEMLRAELLPGFDAPWLDSARRSAHHRRLAALEDVAEAALLAGRHDEAIALAEGVISQEPLRESAHRLVMVAHREAGRIGSALRAYEVCRALLAEEIGTAPSAATSAVYQSLLLDMSDRGDGESDLRRADRTGVQGAVEAMNRIASGTAVASLEAQLAAVERSPHPDPAARLELLLKLGRSRWALSGATEQLRRISLAAGEAALALNAPDHLGAALGLASTTTGIGLRDRDTEDLCERALNRFGGHPATRARVLSLQSELRSGPEAVALAERAVAIARRLGDSGLLLDTLLVLDQSLSWSPDLDARLAVEEECETLLRATSRWRVRPSFEPLTRLQSGDLRSFAAAARRMEEIAERDSQWEPGFYATAYRAVLAHLAGDLGAAFALADELLGQSRQELNAVHSSAGLYLALSRDRGGVGDLLPLIESMAEADPEISTFAAATALGRALLDDRSGADEALRRLLHHAPSLPRDHVWLLTLSLMAEAAALIGDAGHAEPLLALLEPYAGQVCAGAHATVVLGTVDSHLGALCALRGDLDGGERWLRRALRLEERLGAPLMRARTSAALARVLSTRGRPGDRREAAELAEVAWSLLDRTDADGARDAVVRSLRAAGLDGSAAAHSESA